jgi:hypothetical protein
MPLQPSTPTRSARPPAAHHPNQRARVLHLIELWELEARGLETRKTGECKCCDADCRDRDQGSNEPRVPRSRQVNPSEQLDRADHDCKLERCRDHICDAQGLRLTGPWSERQPGRSGNDPRHCDERVAESSNQIDRACGIAHDRDHPAQLSQSYGHEEHPEQPVLREVLIDDREVDRRGTGRRDRDAEAKHLRGLGETTCADANRNERDSEDRHGKGGESLASVEHILHFFLAFMVGDMGGMVVVASSGLPVLLGRNGQRAEDGRGYRQEESKREEETARTDQPEKGFSDWLRGWGSCEPAVPCRAKSLARSDLGEGPKRGRVTLADTSR